MSAVFVGFGTSSTGPTKTLQDVELVKRDLTNQFMTEKGERLLDMNYGFIGWSLLFELKLDNVKTQLEDDARRIIQSDPRVLERSISLTEYEHGYTIAIELYFYTLDTVDTLSLYFKKQS